MMRFTLCSLLVFGSSALTVLAHTKVNNLVVNNKPLEVGDHIVGYPNITYAPVRNPLSPDMNCRISPLTTDLINKADPFTIESGNDVMLEWYSGQDTGDTIIEHHHDGPCLFYMASVPKGNAAPQWFKLDHKGYENEKWCVQKLIDNKGIQNVTIPKKLKAGDYLLRSELIGLQLASKMYGTSTTAGAQFYMNCVHLTVTGSGTVVPSGQNLMSFPSDLYLATSPGILYNEIDPTNYVFPGPPIYDFDSSN